jgi:hypothetical protein
VLDVADDGTIATSRDIILQEWSGSKTMHYYPTWSPDGQYIAFMSGKPGDGGVGAGTFSNRGGVVRIVRADAATGTTCPSADCWELVQGTGHALGDTVFKSTWPKFGPFAQGADSSLVFITLTSWRPYGYLVDGSDQLWTFAVDTSALGVSADASFPPIWLPHQDMSAQNIEGIWTETLPCSNDQGQCQGCVAGEECVTTSTGSCECRAP